MKSGHVDDDNTFTRFLDADEKAFWMEVFVASIKTGLDDFFAEAAADKSMLALRKRNK